MEKNNYLVLILLLVSDFMFAQSNFEKCIVYFKDKPTNIDVTKLFNEKAIQYRKQFNIPFDERDIPVNTAYIEELKNNKVTVLNSSGWLNAALVSIDEKRVNDIKQLPFIASVIKIKQSKKGGGIASIQAINECAETNATQTFEDNYASSFPQTQLLNGQYLHQQGFNGENMIIAICDVGFKNANTNPAFSNIFSEHRILGTYDYTHGDSAVYDGADDGVHGSNCFSFIGGLKANQYIGTATKANFYLFHTEVDSTEKLQEEFNLAIALERCSQIGVKVVSISLGYFIFDDEPSASYDTTDIKTNNTVGARAANIASSKGILVCAAAGNANDGIYVSSPACADSAFAIAGVDINGTPANFSTGVPGDPRVKPNVAAVGVSAKYIDTNGNVGSGAGTSYATPQIAGLSACLWQAFPAKTNWEIKTAIEQSASQYLTPDKKIGYGIPDFEKAYNILATATFVSNKSLEKDLSVYPNPFQGNINIVSQSNIKVENINMMNDVGQTVYSVNNPSENTITLNDLPKGIYLLQIATDKGMLIKKLIKD